MAYGLIVKLRRDSNITIGSVMGIWMLLILPEKQTVTGLAIAAMLAPMAVAALFYGSESRRLLRGDRSRSMTRWLRLGRTACVVLPAAAATDLVWRWERLDPTVSAVSTVVVAASVLLHFSYFHRCVVRTDTGRLRFAHTLMHRTLMQRNETS